MEVFRIKLKYIWLMDDFFQIKSGANIVLLPIVFHFYFLYSHLIYFSYLNILEYNGPLQVMYFVCEALSWKRFKFEIAFSKIESLSCVNVGWHQCSKRVSAEQRSGWVARLLSALTFQLLGQQHPHQRGPTPAVTTAATSAANSAAYKLVEVPTTVSTNGWWGI